MTIVRVLAMIFAALLITGCTKCTQDNPPPPADVPAMDQTSPPAETPPAEGTQPAEGATPTEPAGH